MPHEKDRSQRSDRQAVDVVFTSQLRTLLGVSRVHVDLPASASFDDLLAELARRFAPRFGETVLDGHGRLRAPIMVCFGDEHVMPHATDLLPQGVVITLMSPISGG